MRRVALVTVVLSAQALATIFSGCVSSDETAAPLDVDAGALDVTTSDRAVTPPSEGGGDEVAPIDAAKEAAPEDAANDASSDAPADAPADAPVDAPADGPADADAGSDAGAHAYVYVGGPGGGISGFTWDAVQKKLTAIDTDAVTAGVQTTINAPAGLAVAAHPSGQFLYGCSGNGVAAYAIANGGGLTHLDADAVTAGTQDAVLSSNASTVFVAMHPSGKMLYATDQTNSKMVAFDVDGSTGLLTVHASFDTGSLPRGIALDATGHVMAVVDNAANAISMFKVDAVGVPTAVDANPDAGGRQDFAGGGSNAVSAAFNAAGTRLFLVNTGGPSLTPYTVDPTTAALTALTNATTSSAAPLTAAVHPNGNFVYASGYSSGVVDRFSIAGDGSLSNRVTTTGTGSARGVAFDPTGAFLFVEGDGGTIYVFSVDAGTGALSLVETTSATAANGGYTFAFATR